MWKNYGEPSDDDCHKLSYFLSCPWCLSILLRCSGRGAGSRWPKVWRPISKALALSAATGFIAEAKG